jgi:hypothetical protein
MAVVLRAPADWVEAQVVHQLKQQHQPLQWPQLVAVAVAAHMTRLATQVAATVGLALLLFATHLVQLEVLLTRTPTLMALVSISMLPKEQHLTRVLCTQRRFGRIQLQQHAPLCVRLFHMMAITHLELRTTKSLRSSITQAQGTTTHGIQRSPFVQTNGNTLRWYVTVQLLAFT